MWHYVQNGQGYGPVEASVVQGLIKSGALGPESIVWKDGMADWAPVSTIPEFASSLPKPKPAAETIPPLNLPPKPAPGGAGDSDAADIEQNKLFAVLAYLSILFVVPLIAAPRSKFARYHANQGLILFITSVIVNYWHEIPFVDFAVWPVHRFLWPGIIVLTVLGIVHAASGEFKPLPFIGHFKLLH